MDVVSLAREYEDLCIEMRRDLHRIPELELNLPETVILATVFEKYE